MRSRVDLTGQTFGRLTVDEYAGRLNQKRYYFCDCKCGAFVLVLGADLKNGKTKSCGCLRREVTRQTMTTHGACIGREGGLRTREYQAWQTIKGRKLPIADEWEKFENFLRDVGKRPSDEHSLTRLNHNQPYGPENFLWRSNDDINQRRNLGLPDDLGFCISDFIVDTRPAEAA